MDGCQEHEHWAIYDGEENVDELPKQEDGRHLPDIEKIYHFSIREKRQLWGMGGIVRWTLVAKADDGRYIYVGAFTNEDGCFDGEWENTLALSTDWNDLWTHHISEEDKFVISEQQGWLIWK